MPDYSREELVTELKRRRATKPLEMQPSHVPYSWETPEVSLRRIEGIPEGYGETEPWIDPTSVFAAGAGSGVRAGLQAGKPLVSAAMQGLRSGVAGAAMDYPVGTVAGAVGEKYPAAAFPISVGLGIASGKYIEPKLEAGLRKIPEYAAEAAPYARMKLAEQRGSFSTKPVEEPEYKPFYSQLEGVIESKVQTQKPVDPEAFKQVLKPEHGVKQDELTNTKIKDFLEGKKVVGEKVSKNDVLDYLKEQRTELKDVVLSKEERIKKESTRFAPQFEQYQEPGGTNYREMFVTAPATPKLSIVQKDGEFVIQEADGSFLDSASSFQEAQSKIDEYLKSPEELSARWQDGHPQYADIQNPVVRVRFNEHTDDAGRKILFIEEIQGPSKENTAKMPEWLQKRQYDIGVKRILKYAADNGFDGVSWTPGSIQTKRWGTERVDWQRSGDGWNIAIKEQEGGEAGGIDIETMARERNLLSEAKGIHIKDKEGLVAALRKYLPRTETKIEKIADNVWGKMQKEAEGVAFPRAESFRGLYGTTQAEREALIAEGKTVKPSMLETKFQEITKGKVGETNFTLKQPEVKKEMFGLEDIEMTVPFIPVPKEAKKGYPLYAAIPALGLAGQQEQQPQYTRAELVEELKRRRQTK